MSDDIIIDKEVVKEILDKTAAVEWGFMENDVFVPLPKVPLVNAGYMQPPFDVTLPNGMVRSIIEQPRQGEP